MRKRVLLAENNRVLRSFLSRLLRVSGFFVIEEECGTGALDRMTHFRPDIIVSSVDKGVQEMDGFYLCQEVKAINRLKEVPFLLLTAIPPELNTERFKASGAADLIEMPFDTKAFIEKLNQTLSKRPKLEQ